MTRDEHKRTSTWGGRCGRWVAIGVVLSVLAVATPAVADTHKVHRSGHPLRVLAYVVHPVGVIIDVLFFRPFHWLGNREPVKTLFGHHPND